MASVSRTVQFSKVSKVLKKHYQAVKSDPERPVFEHLLYACCLENAHYQATDESFAALVHTFFDFNEMRVTSIAELSEVMSVLPAPRAAANRLKRVLQSVFEATYAFDLEESRKKNLGPTVKWLHDLDGATNFTVSYVVQSALGGHAIPVDSGVLKALRICALVTDKDVKKCVVPGLERAIAKSKGIEFGSMLHQLGADFTANPYSPALHKILLQIEPDCHHRLPKRRARRKPPAQSGRGPKKEPAEQAAEKKPAATKKKTSGRGKKAAARMEAAPDEKKGKSASQGISKKKPR